MPYNLFDYHIEIFRDEQDNDFGAFVKEIPYVSAFGETPADAVKELETAYRLWLESSVENGDEIPAPLLKNEVLQEFSGKFSLRIPRSLHHNLVQRAKMENVSLNQEILFLLSYALGMKSRTE